MNIFRMFIFFLIFSAIHGCSFQSKQFSFLMNTLENKGNDGPAPNWTMAWTGINISVYAINNENHIYFANYDDYFLEFDGQQIIKAVGFFPNQAVAGIRFVGNNLTYFLNVYALKTLPPTTIGAFAYLQPIITIIYAVLTGNDTLDWVKILACSLVFFGVYLVSFKKKIIKI